MCVCTQKPALTRKPSIQNDLNVFFFLFTLSSLCVPLGLATIAQCRWLLSALPETVGRAESSSITISSWKCIDCLEFPTWGVEAFLSVLQTDNKEEIK